MQTHLQTYTPEQVAEILQVSKNMVYELIARGELYAKKIGRMYRIPAAAVEYFTHNLDYHTLVLQSHKEVGTVKEPPAQAPKVEESV
jgi:excisionase family DNA binding protein